MAHAATPQRQGLPFGHRTPRPALGDGSDAVALRPPWLVCVPVIDYRAREVLGHAVERTGRPETTEQALQEAPLTRLGTLRSAPAIMRLRHDNGLVLGSLQCRAVVRDYGLQQEYIKPSTPQQNGLCERFIKTFKEQLCWSQRFASLEHARMNIQAWIHNYNHRRPHQALNYRTQARQHHLHPSSSGKLAP